MHVGEPRHVVRNQNEITYGLGTREWTIARKRVVRQSTPAQTDGGMVLGGRNLPRCFQARPKLDWKVRLSPAAGYCFSRQRILWVNDIPREPSGRYSRDHTCCTKLHSAELAFSGMSAKLKGWTVPRICIGGGTSILGSCSRMPPDCLSSDKKRLTLSYFTVSVLFPHPVSQQEHQHAAQSS
jgi:hypothetical protein